MAEGIYTPTVENGGRGDRYQSFQLKNAVAVYGGFEPDVGDIRFKHRDWVVHETILSGDLNGDDGSDFANNQENSYHVFYHPEGTDLDGSAILDGFIISGGNANLYVSPHWNGGGMYNEGSSPTLVNCRFAGNWAAFFGGAMFNSSSSPVLNNCTFSSNASNSGGGGMFNAGGSSPVLSDCTFSANSSTSGGGGMFNSVSSPTLTNCSFSANSAGTAGGGMYNYHSSAPVLINCTFSANSASQVGGGVFNNASSPALTNCTFSANSAGYSGGAMFNDDSSPALTNCILWGDTPDEVLNTGPESLPVVTYSDIEGGYDGVGNIDKDPRFVDPGSGDFHLETGSRCIDAGNNAAPYLPPYDFEGDDRVLDGDGDGEPRVDMGVDEVLPKQPRRRKDSR